MATQTEVEEAAVLEVLGPEGSIKLEDVVDLLPQMSWNQVFQCIDCRMLCKAYERQPNIPFLP